MGIFHKYFAKRYSSLHVVMPVLRDKELVKKVCFFSKLKAESHLP